MSENHLQLLARRKKSHKWLIPFFTAGYPSTESTEQLVHAALDAGADVIELGIPFSDPLADGPAIQFASHHSLTSGMTLERLFEMAQAIRAATPIPILFMGYINPMLSYGLTRFVEHSHDVGVDGFIVPDMPLEESGELKAVCDEHGLSLVQLVAPTSPMSRVKLLANASPDMLYAVTIAGVTGARKNVSSDTIDYLTRVRRNANGPVVAGFGISSSETAKALAEPVDGVVVGSALIEIIRAASSESAAIKSVGLFLKTLRSSLNELSV